MRKIINYLIGLFIILSFYYLISIFLSNSRQFIKYYPVETNTSLEAKDIGVLINDTPIINYIGEDKCDNLKFWVSKNKYWKQFGILPIGYYSIDKNNMLLNMIYPKHLSDKKIFVEFQDYSKMSEHSMQGRFYKANSKVHVIIKDDDEVVLCELDVDLGESSN
ncbi:MAG: hypothetical protein ACJAVQ_001020 [Nonlabens sp.]|jgi:hypothetical protein